MKIFKAWFLQEIVVCCIENFLIIYAMLLHANGLVVIKVDFEFRFLFGPNRTSVRPYLKFPTPKSLFYEGVPGFTVSCYGPDIFYC